MLFSVSTGSVKSESGITCMINLLKTYIEMLKSYLASFIYIQFNFKNYTIYIQVKIVSNKIVLSHYSNKYVTHAHWFRGHSVYFVIMLSYWFWSCGKEFAFRMSQQGVYMVVNLFFSEGLIIIFCVCEENAINLLSNLIIFLATDYIYKCKV